MMSIVLALIVLPSHILWRASQHMFPTIFCETPRSQQCNTSMQPQYKLNTGHTTIGLHLIICAACPAKNSASESFAFRHDALLEKFWYYISLCVGGVALQHQQRRSLLQEGKRMSLKKAQQPRTCINIHVKPNSPANPFLIASDLSKDLSPWRRLGTFR